MRVAAPATVTTVRAVSLVRFTSLPLRHTRRDTRCVAVTDPGGPDISYDVPRPVRVVPAAEGSAIYDRVVDARRGLHVFRFRNLAVAH
jgi:hypothetical protein